MQSTITKPGAMTACRPAVALAKAGRPCLRSKSALYSQGRLPAAFLVIQHLGDKKNRYCALNIE
jgi:hypothetical protein